MYKIKLLGFTGPKGGTSKPYYYGVKGKEAVAVTSNKKDLIKVYKTKFTATKALQSAKTAFPNSNPKIVEF